VSRVPDNLSGFAPFSEKGFYLSELRDRTIAIAGRGDQLSKRAPLEAVLNDLAANGTRVVFVSDAVGAFESLDVEVVPVGELNDLRGRLWRCLTKLSRVGVAAKEPPGFEAFCRDVIGALGIRKLIWVDAAGGLLRPDGARDSFVDVDDLRGRLAADGGSCERRPLLAAIEAMLNADLPSVNLCRLDGVADELFTYDGSGTLFTRRGYVDVRALGLDDFDAAADLIGRGTAEGYLVARSPEEIDLVLAGGFGAFVGGNHLAGIGTLLLHSADRAAEIASLYTLTRFLGEGVGGHLVRYAAEQARGLGCQFVFACTSSDRVVAFFERNGFERVEGDRLPDEKWRGYDATRRERTRCLLRDL
jgi:N-acetylglutamate synthase-like GNAT family acetyltransferase